MAVEAIRLQNFMAFEDTDWIELRPISLLFGKNSSGKSAIIRALLLLRQSLYAPADESPLLFRSPDGFDFGDFNSVLHKRSDGKKADRQIGFQFRCRLDANLEQRVRDEVDFRREHFNAKIAEIENQQRYFDLKLFFDFEKAGKVALSELAIICPWIEIDGETEITIFAAELLDWKRALEMQEKWWFWSDFFLDNQKNHTNDLWALLDIITVVGFLPILKVGEFESPQGEPEMQNLKFVIDLLEDFKKTIGAFLLSIAYLGPMRPEPRRTYAMDEMDRLRWEKKESGDFLRFLSGNADEADFKKIDDRMKYLLLGDKLVVERARKSENFDERSILTQINVQESTDGEAFNLKDVGYGTSQVLPIVIQSVLAKKLAGTFVIIEQPELHLHPSLQAAMADFFIDMIYKLVEIEENRKVKLKREKNNIHFLLETHSEHLLLRMRRRIAESSAGKYKKPKRDELSHFLNTSDLAIYFANRQNGTSTIEEINIGDFGDFLKIAEGFYDFFTDDLLESAEMVRAKLIAQRKKG